MGGFIVHLDSKEFLSRTHPWSHKDVPDFEKQMRRKVHYVIQPPHLWNSIANLARTQNGELLNTLQAGFKYIENESFESTFNGLFSEINLGSDKLLPKISNQPCLRIPHVAPRADRGSGAPAQCVSTKTLSTGRAERFAIKAI